MKVTYDQSYSGSRSNCWCHECGRNTGKAHAHDCVYRLPSPSIDVYRACDRGVLAERLVINLPPKHTKLGREAEYVDESGKVGTIDMEFVDGDIPEYGVLDVGDVWYSRYPFVVLPDGETFGPESKDFDGVSRELMNSKLGDVYQVGEAHERDE